MLRECVVSCTASLLFLFQFPSETCSHQKRKEERTRSQSKFFIFLESRNNYFMCSKTNRKSQNYNPSTKTHGRKSIICVQSHLDLFVCLFVCVEVLRPSQPYGVMSSAVGLPNHTITGQA